MQAVGRLGSYISQGVYTVSGPFHPFGGAVDIVVVEQEDGSYKSSPWYVRFGKFQGVLKAREKVVDIRVNDVKAGFQMHLDHKGEAFFLREIDAQEAQESGYFGDDVDDHPRSLRSKSCNFDANDGGNIVDRSGSRRSRILGLMFGRKSMKPERGDDDGIENRVDSLERAEIAANLLDLKWSTNLSGQRDQNVLDTSPPELNEDVCFDVAQSDVQVACVEMKLETCMENLLNGEEISDGNTGNDNDEDISVDRVHVNFHDEVLHSATVLISEGTETEEVTKNADLGMPILELSEFQSLVRQTNCSDSDVGIYNEVVVEEQTFPKSHTVDMGLGHSTSEKVESNSVTKSSSSSSLDETKGKDVSSTLSSPLNSIRDCLPRKASRISPSTSLGEDNFLFSDLDETGNTDRFERSFSHEHVDKEDHISHENGIEKLTAISTPIAIPRNEAAAEEVGQHIGSLPNISSSTNSIAQRDVFYPLSQSLDSKSSSLQWELAGKDDLNCLKSDEDKENQLSHEEPGAKDYHDSGEFEGDPSTHMPSPGGNWRLWPFSLRRTESRNPMLPPTPSPRGAKNNTFGISPEHTITADMNKKELTANILKKKVRVTTPTSEQLASLNLKDGMNTVTFTFSTAVLGKQQVDARIYLWKWNTRIVISDVDGTITRSDVLGQFMPLVGIDWSQTGVAHLFSAIKENGYQLLFLSARSISQAYLTRQFLVNLKQDGKVLPDGPVVISPDGLFPSLYREVIRRVPHEFKIACLEDIKALFPSDCNPFYAGFGNRDTDEISYLKVGIPKGKIFIINPKFAGRDCCKPC
ncbi:phosphatidate phosphatase PAH1-like isoform X2 [Abrus precatorius]|uniref:Phosphatidate phosphatase PAH1-like isoform X2 n=1 Tax=Abrus precatorius TaxID=3816 RepID=A0A8B8LCH5_ABRPR|nr:phosphatidate phosphatase PAH1-like isoform X2 [Abrus precatorius]